MSNINFTERILETIEQRRIIPRSRSYFVLKNFLFWALFVLSLSVAIIAVAAMMYLLLDREWDIFAYLGGSFVTQTVVSIPYLWLGVFVAVVLLATYIVRFTNRGYRYQPASVVGLEVLASFMLGSMLLVGGIGAQVHETLVDNLPHYEHLVYSKDDIWIAPENGLLGGEVVEVAGEDDFVLQDFNDTLWQIAGEEAVWPENFVLQEGVKVKLVGYMEDDNAFSAKLVRAWEKDWLQ